MVKVESVILSTVNTKFSVVLSQSSDWIYYHSDRIDGREISFNIWDSIYARVRCGFFGIFFSVVEN